MIEWFYATSEANMPKISSAQPSAFSTDHNHPSSVFAIVVEIMRARKSPDLHCV
jgi:hypothetical protein